MQSADRAALLSVYKECGRVTPRYSDVVDVVGGKAARLMTLQGAVLGRLTSLLDEGWSARPELLQLFSWLSVVLDFDIFLSVVVGGSFFLFLSFSLSPVAPPAAGTTGCT